VSAELIYRHWRVTDVFIFHRASFQFMSSILHEICSKMAKTAMYKDTRQSYPPRHRDNDSSSSTSHLSPPNFVSNILSSSCFPVTFINFSVTLVFMLLYIKCWIFLRAFLCIVSNFVGKLLGRTQKIAYNLLHKVGPKGDPSIKPGDRVCWFLNDVFFTVCIQWYVRWL